MKMNSGGHQLQHLQSVSYTHLDVYKRQVYLRQEHGKLTLELVYIAFHVLAPDKGVLVGLGLYLRAVDILHIKCDKTFLCQQKNQLCEHV